MAAIDFPTSPTNGQVYAGWIYDSSLPGWRNVNSDSGVAALSSMGLKNVVPTSISVGSGSATVNANGTITVSGANSLTINGAFPTTYTKFLIATNITATASGNVTFQLSSAGTAATTAYTHRIIYTDYGTSTMTSIGGDNISNAVLIYSLSRASGQMNIQDPNQAGTTSWNWLNAQSGALASSAGYHNVATAYDGIKLSATSITGTFNIYGYTK